MVSTIEELRAEARRLLQAAGSVAGPEAKKELAERALELSERAEALANAMSDPWLLRANIERYRSLLASGELNADQISIVKEMLADAEALESSTQKKKAP
jgi:hypothetical protein